MPVAPTIVLVLFSGAEFSSLVSRPHIPMASSITLPFIAAAIPSALPTNAEIEHSRDVLSAYGNRTVVRVGRHFVVKYGQGVDIIEGENMLFVQSRTTVTIPKVYALYIEPSTKKNYIIMENVDGDTLASRWPSLTRQQKEVIVAKLRCLYEELRQIPSPGYFGSLGERHLLDEVFWTREEAPSINGPFKSEDALNEAMALKYIHDGRPTYKADFYRQSLSHVFRGHQPTFTHADCQRKNIIICKVAPGDRDLNADHRLEDEYKVTIVDWEKAGWYPSYWEYSVALYALRWDDDWGLFIPKMLSPYHSEAPWLQMLRLELWS